MHTIWQSLTSWEGGGGMWKVCHFIDWKLADQAKRLKWDGTMGVKRGLLGKTFCILTRSKTVQFDFGLSER